MKQFYTIYERLIKAKDLIAAQVEEDILKYESLRPSIEQIKLERFDVFLGGILSSIAGVMESNKYEDFTRSLFGNQAYFLFLFDKLITGTVKNLLNFANEDAC